MPYSGTRSLSRLALFAALLPALLSACATVSAPRPIQQVRDPAHLFSILTAQSDTLNDLRTRSRVSLEIDGVRQKATGVVFFKQPDDLRLEVTGTLGVSIMSAKFWSDSLSVYLPSEKGYLDGPAARVLYQVTGVDLSHYNVQRVILGLPTLDHLDRDKVVGFSVEESTFVIHLLDNGWNRKLWVDRRTMAITREDIIDHYGKRRSRLEMSDYSEVSGCMLPGKVSITQGINQISFDVESHRVNTGLADQLFSQVIPPGVHRLNAEQ